MGIVPVGGGYSGSVPASQYRGGSVVSSTQIAVGGREIVPALDWTGEAYQDEVVAVDDPELPDWVEEEYGGLHEGLENAPIQAEVPVKRKPGRPRKVKV